MRCISLRPLRPAYFTGLCVLCGKNFNRKVRKESRKVRKEKHTILDLHSFSLWNPCALCAFVVKKINHRGHKEHRGKTQVTTTEQYRATSRQRLPCRFEERADCLVIVAQGVCPIFKTLHSRTRNGKNPLGSPALGNVPIRSDHPACFQRF